MKGQMMRLAVAMLLVVGLSAANAATQKTTRPAKATKTTAPQVKVYTGTVKVTKNKAGHITAVKLHTGALSRTYNVVLNKEGRALADKMAGKRVQVKGLLETKSGKTVLAVRDYGPVPPKSKKTPAAKPVKATNSTPKR